MARECFVCMESDPEPVALGCSCRSHTGYAHVACMVKFALETGNWRSCMTCRRAFTGKMLVGLADARWLHARGPSVSVTERVGAMRHVAVGYAERGQYTAAVRLARDARESAVGAFGEMHGSSLNAAAELANILQLSGSSVDLDEAIAINERALAVRVSWQGDGHANTLAVRASLVSCLSDRGRPIDLRRAERTQRAIIDAETSAFGARHAMTLTTRCDLALTLVAMRKYAAAREVYDALIPTLETELGPDHPSAIVSLGNMASCLSGSGDHDAAVAMLERVVRSAKRVFGAVHPDTRVARRNLAKTRSAARLACPRGREAARPRGREAVRPSGAVRP